MRTSRLWMAMLLGVLVVASGVTWVALNAIAGIEQANDERESWIAIDSALLELSNEVAEVVVETRGRALSGDAVIAGATDLRAEFDEMMATLDAQVAVVVDPDDRAAFDEVLERISRDIESIAASVDVIADAQGSTDPAPLDRRLQRLLIEHQLFQLHLDDLAQVRFDAESDRLTSLADASSRRFDLVILASLPIAALVVALVRLGRRTERREARLTARLDLERRQAQAIVDSMPTGIAWIGRNGRVLGLNRPMRDVLSTWTSAEPIGETLSDLATARWTSTAARLEQLIVRTLTDGGVHADELHEVRDGVSHTIRLASSPLVEGDRVVGAILLGEDVTAARETERALAMSGRMESIGHLAAGVAHEINTPVQFVTDNVRFVGEAFVDVVDVVQPLADIARQTDAAAADHLLRQSELRFLRTEVPTAIAQSLDGLTRVSEIVGAMNSFSHPGAETAVVDVNSIVGTTLAVARGEWRSIADLDLRLDPAIPLVDGREGDLKQVLLNLVVNAAHAVGDLRADDDGATDDGPDGEPRLGRIGVETVADGDLVRIRVTDDGVGMTDDVRQRVFDQFFTTKPIGRGTGQGLSVSWDIVSAHGGWIDVDSTPGVGTTFTVTLPAHRPTTTPARDRDADCGGDRPVDDRSRSTAGVVR
ncbi:MAG: ATP-binding protein [Actinomycetota bacterium]